MEDLPDCFDPATRRPRSTPLDATTRTILEEMRRLIQESEQRLEQRLTSSIGSRCDELEHGVTDLNYRCEGFEHSISSSIGSMFDCAPIHDEYNDEDGDDIFHLDDEPIYNQYGDDVCEPVYNDDDIVHSVLELTSSSAQLDDVFRASRHTLPPTMYEEELFEGLVKEAAEDEQDPHQADAVMEQHAAASTTINTVPSYSNFGVPTNCSTKCLVEYTTDKDPSVDECAIIEEHPQLRLLAPPTPAAPMLKGISIVHNGFILSGESDFTLNSSSGMLSTCSMKCFSLATAAG